MTIDFKKEPINLSEMKMNTISTVMVDGDVIVPDVKPDMKEILLAEANAIVNSKEYLNGKLTVSGTIFIKILYAPDNTDADSPKVKSIENKFEFKDSVDCPNEDGLQISVKAGTEHIEFSLINSRKLNMKVIVALTAKAYSRKTAEICCGVEGEAPLETRMKGLNLYNIVADEQKDVIITDSLEIPNTKPEVDEILKMDVHAVKGDCKLMNNKILLKGTLHIATLYSSIADGYCLEHMEHEIPFSEVVDIDGLGEECMCNVVYDIKDVFYTLKEDINGEPRVISIEVLVGASITASRTWEANVVDDCYSPAGNTRILRDKLSMDELINEGTSQLSVKEIVSVPENMPQIDAVYNVACKPIIAERVIDQDKLIIRGSLVAFILYVSSGAENPMYSLVQEFPFEQTVALDESNEKMLCECDVNVLSTSYTLNAASEIELRCALEFYSKVILPYEIELISGCDVEEPEEDAEPEEIGPRLVIYFVQKGDTMWDIAKRYRTTARKIMAANQMDEERSVLAGQKLLIPRV